MGECGAKCMLGLALTGSFAVKVSEPARMYPRLLAGPLAVKVNEPMRMSIFLEYSHQNNKKLDNGIVSV